MAAKIDLDRGVTIKRDRATGVYINMYRDEPGVFFDQHGNKVAPAMAASAGFDTGALLKLRERQTKVEDFMRKLDETMAVEPKQEVVLAAKGGYKVVELPLGNANVLDTEGNKLNPIPISQAVAMEMLGKLTDSKDDKK